MDLYEYYIDIIFIKYFVIEPIPPKIKYNLNKYLEFYLNLLSEQHLPSGLRQLKLLGSITSFPRN